MNISKIIFHKGEGIEDFLFEIPPLYLTNSKSFVHRRLPKPKGTKESIFTWN